MGKNRKQPFGYKMESGRVVVHTGESTWVRYLFREYNTGASVRALAEYMQGMGFPYDEGKRWNINMIARILADDRYIGASDYPEIVDSEVFQDAAEKRKKKAPAVQKTEAQKALRKRCVCRITPHIEHEVLCLLNSLAAHTEQIAVPNPTKEPSQRLDALRSELTELMDQLPVEVERAHDVLRELSASMYEAIDPREYETQRLRLLFQGEEQRSELDANLIAISISAVLVDGNGKVRIRLKNDQTIERGE